MKEIYHDVMKHLNDVSGNYVSVMSTISQTAKELREQMLKDKKIIPLPRMDYEFARKYSLCAIDGASGIEKLQSGDLMVAASTLAEGINSKPIFGQGSSPDKPYSSFAFADVHTSKNEQILSGMRAFTEISVLGASEHNVSIIDGSYLGNFLTVLYQLQDSYETASVLLGYLENDKDKNFMKGLSKIFNVKKQFDTQKFVVSLAKSDSSREMVNRYVSKERSAFFTDKMLAEYLLKPGEMILPSSVRSNTGRSSLLSETDNGWSGFKWNVKELEKSNPSWFNLIEEFFGSNWQENLHSMFTYLFDFGGQYKYFYFKPTKSSQGSNPLRVELAVDKNTDVLPYAQLIAQLIDSDMVSNLAKEPHCQYVVDREVKDPVSRALKSYRSELVRRITATELHVEGVATNYRT